jgi:hypothetical protein
MSTTSIADNRLRLTTSLQAGERYRVFGAVNFMRYLRRELIALLRENGSFVDGQAQWSS